MAGRTRINLSMRKELRAGLKDFFGDEMTMASAYEHMAMNFLNTRIENWKKFIRDNKETLSMLPDQNSVGAEAIKRNIANAEKNLNKVIEIHMKCFPNRCIETAPETVEGSADDNNLDIDFE